MEKAKEAGLEKELEAAAESVETDVKKKVEDGAKVALCDIYGPHPSCALVKFWQGVVELCLGLAVIVSVLQTDNVPSFALRTLLLHYLLSGSVLCSAGSRQRLCL